MVTGQKSLIPTNLAFSDNRILSLFNFVKNSLPLSQANWKYFN
jgi:hypothetical protein